MNDIIEQEVPDPRIFYVWPKRKGEIFGSVLACYDFENTVNDDCKENSFKVIEYFAYENLLNENESLRIRNKDFESLLKEFNL